MAAVDLRCGTLYCLNKPVPGKNYCSKCRSRKYRAADPIKATYYNLRCNAKRRGIYCAISLAEFRTFCTATGYIEGKGVEADSLTIDRINPLVGYTINNIQVLTLKENLKKRYKDATIFVSRCPKLPTDPF